ncbi:hypothetical protein mRhiFer1_012370 [Rhinolophus ferrumequinum]|uniref:G-protein coupled receptors family 1 profile domain-containing protein n=1 Tax=Rhinolophus ferrumequinum TaxID=59479 RepID=A0A7J7W8Q8_RHIFE|nr:hypothetical protein mRhiFer1_012370 [Rhinolophus ferrumequinum]
MVLLGNCLVLHVIRTEPSLHQPMFYFLAMLALTDLCMGLCTVHTGIIHFVVSIMMRSAVSILPVIIRLKFFHYCRPHNLSHSFCLHQDLLRLVCSDIRFNSFYALALVICTLLLDAVLILISYVFILQTVLAIASREERLKSLQTCVSHICAVLVFYIPIIGLTMVHRFGKHLSPLVHVLMGNIYILFPPLMNPIIYSVKTEQLRSRMKKWFSSKMY